jgi:hypothetical protein
VKEISFEEAKKIAKRRNLKPARLKGTEILNFIKNPAGRYEEISWQELEALVKKYGRTINEDNSWLKIL